MGGPLGGSNGGRFSGVQVRAGIDSGSPGVFSRSGWRSGAPGFRDGILTTPAVHLNKNKH